MDIQEKARMLMFRLSKNIKNRQSSLLTRVLKHPVRTHNFIQGKIHPTFRTNYS